MTAAAGRPAIMLVAGEASGDLHGATLCRALRALAPRCRLSGMGGAGMAAAGMDVLVNVTAAAAVGGTEALGRVPGLYRAYRRLRAALREGGRPDVLVLIDFPEFNLILARAARRARVPVVYFIPPQLWAWRRGRLRTIRRRVSLVLAVFPFEAALYRQAGVRVEFVGHPVLDVVTEAPDRATARARLAIEPERLTIGLLPGSRRQEVDRILPAMAEAARRIGAVHPGARFLLALAPTIAAATVAPHIAGPPPIQVVTGGAHAVIRAADLALVTSGTATLEAALLGTPMLVCYRLSWLSEALARRVIRVPWISLANITLGRAVVPELYRRATTGEALARAALDLLRDPGALEAQRRAFRELAGQLGEPGVGARAARLVLEAAAAPS